MVPEPESKLPWMFSMLMRFINLPNYLEQVLILYSPEMSTTYTHYFLP